MKTTRLALTAVAALALAACGPAKIEMLEEINTSETAFLVPLEGATAPKDQSKFMSVEYLNQPEVKVAAKRVVIPMRKKATGRGWWKYEWIPMMKVIKVDRSPVTREWTSDANTGTTVKDQGIVVESLESIGFSVGVNITAAIEEEDAAKFLYHYTSAKALGPVVDENVRGFVTQILSEKFGVLALDECKAKKTEIFHTAFEETKKHFQEFGITITSMGLSEGLTYLDKEIQDIINKANVAEMEKTIAKFEYEAQIERNKTLVEKAKAENEAAEAYAKSIDAIEIKTRLQIYQDALEKWDGRLPTFMNSGENGAMPFVSIPFPPAGDQAMTPRGTVKRPAPAAARQPAPPAVP